MLTAALLTWSAFGPVSCEPANGGWRCLASAHFTSHGGNGLSGGSSLGGGAGADPNVACLRGDVCDQVAFTPLPARVTTGDVAIMASDALPLPAPVPWTDPAGRTWVGFATFLHLDPALWRTVSATATAGDQTVTATAHAVRAVWDLGEATVTCTSPTCEYTFRRASISRPGGVQEIVVSLYYTVDWSCSGRCSPGSGRLDPLATKGRTSLRVAEIQTIIG